MFTLPPPPQQNSMSDVLEDLLRGDPSEKLCLAIREGDVDQVRSACAQPAIGIGNLSAKMESIEQGRADLLRLLLESNDTISEDLVALACRKKDKECLSILLQHGWSIDNHVYEAASLLCLVVDDEDLTRWLIGKGANMNVTSVLDESVLSIAIAHGTLDVVQLLLSLHADITHGDLLHCAAERPDQDEGSNIAKALLQQGLDVNQYRYDNAKARRLRGMSRLVTPLHTACYAKNVSVARVLLEHGANPNLMVRQAQNFLPPSARDLIFNGEENIRVPLAPMIA